MSNKNKLLFKLLINKIPHLIIIFLLIITNNALMFASSFFIKIIVDKIIPNFLKNTLLIIFLSFSFLAITRVFGLTLQNYLVKKITIEYEWNLYNLFLKKLKQTLFLQLQKLSNGDYLRRMFLISEISNFVVNFYLVIFHHSLTLIVSTSVLMWLSFKMFALTLLMGFLMIITIFFFQIKIKFLSQKMIDKQQKTLNMFSDITNLLHQLKTNHYAKFLKKYYIKTLEINKTNEYKIWKINWYQNLINQSFLLISPLILIYIGTNLIFNNNLSMGNLLFFTNFFHYFIDMLKNITTFCLNFHYNYRNIKSLEFFLNLENEKKFNNTVFLQKINHIKLAKIQINLEKFTLKITKLSIKNNIHLQGLNGSGKTTLLNIISARYFGDNEIFVNNLPLSKYNLREYRNKICFITHNEYLPNVNVLQYITLEDTEAQNIFWHNYHRYFLRQIFNKLKIDINYQITNNGQNLSSGQRQFIICLRLLVFKYDVIILDEAIENIDNEILKFLKWAINDFQKAIFIEISHSQKYLTKGVVININDIKQN